MRRELGKLTVALLTLNVCQFKIGDKVRVISPLTHGHGRRVFHNMLVEIESVERTSCRVLMLEGPAEMTKMNFAFHRLKPFDQVDALGPISNEGRSRH